MRSDGTQFAQANEAPAQEPRFVVAILFDSNSIYCTSHADIANVPGNVLNAVLKAPSALSQRIIPEEGRSEIGSFSFSLVDIDGVFTDAVRDKLFDDEEGIRGKTVRFYKGFAGFDFTAFQLFQTQIVSDCALNDGVYSIECDDITRGLRKEIFEPVSTTLRLPLTDTDTTVGVYSTSAFLLVQHGPSWSDGPNEEVGYLQIGTERIRYTGKTADSFTGCTRGVLNTKAVAHPVDQNTEAERRTKVEEVIYLELPAVKLLLAVLTGELHDSADTLPDHWHLGIDPAQIRLSDYENIGPDLWVPEDDEAALVLRFEGLKKQDGKRFVEKEVCLVLGCYQPVYADGTLGLRRTPALISDATTVVTLNEDNVVRTGELRHDLAGMRNKFRIRWSYDSLANDFRRETLWLDPASEAINGPSEEAVFEFKGLHGSRHTDGTIAARMDAARDRTCFPPLRISVTSLGSLDRIEVGDSVRLTITNIRDYSNLTAAIDRAFEVQQKSCDFVSGDVVLELFGSTLRPRSVPAFTGENPPLPDVYYSAEGVALSSVLSISSDTVATGSHTLSGHAELTHDDAIFYHLGDLTIPSGCNVTIEDNVQLRIRGHLSLNGTINGVGNGHVGVADDGSGAWHFQFSGTPGFVGHTRGHDGVLQFDGAIHNSLRTLLTESLYSAFPFLDLVIAGTDLLGLPLDLRGSGGAPGGRIIDEDLNIVGVGGAGANGGAGLAIICRGMSFGVSASITLDGDDSAATSLVFGGGLFNFPYYPGSGGGGGPGSLLILLDGEANLSIPDVTGKFFARAGDVQQLGTQMQERVDALSAESPNAGFNDPALISGQDFTNAAHRIQYVPRSVAASADLDERPPPPTNLVVVGGVGFNDITVTPPAPGTYDTIQVRGAINNNRANAIPVGEGRQTRFTHELPILTKNWYWSRTARQLPGGNQIFSDWYPFAPDAGVSATTLNPGGWTPVSIGTAGATMITTVSTIEKSGGVADWDSSVYSQEIFWNGAIVSFRPAQTNLDFAIGLNFNAAISHHWNTIDFAWHPSSSGLYILENGAQIGPISGSYDTSTVLAIHHDGALVRYLRDGVVIRSVPALARAVQFDSSFYSPGAKAIDVKVTPTAGEALAAQADFLETFEHQNWQALYKDVANAATLTVTYPEAGENGGHVLQAAGGQLAITRHQLIPYDPTSLYLMTARIRRTAAGGGALVYIGVEGVAANGVTLINTSGANSPSNQHYVCANAFDLSAIALNTWVTISGYFHGHDTVGIGASEDPADPSPLYTGVRFIRPLLFMNFASGTGTQQCDYIRIEKVVDTGLLAPHSATETLSASDSGAAFQIFSDDEGYALSVSYTPAVPVEVSVTCTFESQVTGAFPGEIEALAAAFMLQDGVETLGQASDVTVTAPDRQGFTVQAIFSAEAGLLLEAGLWVSLQEITDPGNLVTYNPNIVVVIIKR